MQVQVSITEMYHHPRSQGRRLSLSYALELKLVSTLTEWSFSSNTTSCGYCSLYPFNIPLLCLVYLIVILVIFSCILWMHHESCILKDLTTISDLKLTQRCWLLTVSNNNPTLLSVRSICINKVLCAFCPASTLNRCLTLFFRILLSFVFAQCKIRLNRLKMQHVDEEIQQ